MKNQNNGLYDRTIKKIKYQRKKKKARNNVRAKIKKEGDEYENF